MAVQVTISDITGVTPYDIYICQNGGTGCFYISTISSTDLPYVFDIPAPNNTSSSYMLKVVDANNCQITGISTV